MLPPLLPRLGGGPCVPSATPLPPLHSLHVHGLQLAALRATSPVLVPCVALPRHPPDEELRAKFEQLQTPRAPTKYSLRDRDDTQETEEANDGARSPDTVDKRARRKEQCRVNQANYRKRKRQHELRLGGAIDALQREIEALTAQRQALAACESDGPEHAIAAFYLAMQGTSEAPTTPTDRSTLLALQSEQFASLDELTRAWRAHQRGFACFRLHVLSTERLEAGDCVIVKADGELEVALHGDGEDDAPLVCPVQQRFEIDSCTNAVARVTSEVDLIAGVASARGSAISETRRAPLAVARMLEGLR